MFREAIETLRLDAAVKLTTLGSTAARKPIVSRLRERGYEVTKSYARRLLSEQLTEVLANGAFVPLKDVKALVVGTTVTERLGNSKCKKGETVVQSQRVHGRRRRVKRGGEVRTRRLGANCGRQPGTDPEACLWSP